MVSLIIWCHDFGLTWWSTSMAVASGVASGARFPIWTLCPPISCLATRTITKL